MGRLRYCRQSIEILANTYLTLGIDNGSRLVLAALNIYM